MMIGSCNLPLLVAAVLAIAVSPASAQFTVARSVVGSGATDATSGSMRLVGTVGQAVVGRTSLPSRIAWQGFWYTTVDRIVTGVREDHTADMAAGGLALLRNHPNPFSERTEIEVHLPARAHVTLKIFDALGREVRTLIDGEREPGRIAVQFSASGLASGHYVAQLTANGARRTMTMVLAR